MRDSELLERLRVLGGLWANLAAARIEALIAERDALAQKRNDAERVAGVLTLENEALQADNARLRKRIQNQTDQINGLERSRRRLESLMAGADRRVELVEADNARLRDALDKDLASILKGKPLTEPPHVFPGKDAENYWRLRTQLGEAQAGRSILMCEVYRQQAVKTQRKADADADQASIRERKLRDTIAALTGKETE
jgi:hypothetical protein